MTNTLIIEGPQLNQAPACEQILRSVPEWFGIEASLLMYAQATASMPTFALRADSDLVGFISLQQHFPASWEVYCVALHANARNRGYVRTDAAKPWCGLARLNLSQAECTSLLSA